MLRKPLSVEANSYKSRKWDELQECGKFAEKDIPVLELLCHWWAVIDDCLKATTKDDRVKATSRSANGDIRPDPRLSIIKGAYAEIRALNKQLGINDEVAQSTPKAQITVLETIQSRRREKQTSQTTPTGRKKAI